MTAQQRKVIFGLSKGLNIDKDNLHILVNGLTGCESLTELTDVQADGVIRELRSRMQNSQHTQPPKSKSQEKPAVPGMMTKEQQNLAWRLMYRLQELDSKPKLHENGTPYTVGERMCGAIYTILGNNMANPDQEIFDRVTFSDGVKLIEGLKRYVKSAERRAEKGGVIMKLTAAAARRIVGEAVTRKVLIITVTENEQREIKYTLIDHIRNMRLWELTARQNFRYHIHINGLESICIMDYETWIRESRQKFCGMVFVTSKCLSNLPYIDGEPIVLE